MQEHIKPVCDTVEAGFSNGSLITSHATCSSAVAYLVQDKDAGRVVEGESYVLAPSSNGTVVMVSVQTDTISSR